MANGFVSPSLEDIISTQEPSAPQAPVPEGFKEPPLEDVFSGSVMENWDPTQGRVVSPAEGFQAPLRPFGVDLGLPPLPESVSQALAKYGGEKYGQYLGAKQIGAGLLSYLPGIGERYEKMLSEMEPEIRQVRRAGKELGATPGGAYGGLGLNLAEAMALGRGLPQTSTSAFSVGAGYGALEPTLPGESRGVNIAGGGMLGLGGKWASDVAGKGVQGLGGAIPEWLRPYTGNFGKLPREVEERLALARRAALPVRAGDVTGNPNVMRIEAMAEATPFSGMGDFVNTQIQAARRYFGGAKERLGNKFGFKETSEAVQGVLRNYDKISKESERLYDQLGRIARSTGYKTNVTTQELGPALQRLQVLDNNFWTKPFVTDDVKPLLQAVASGTKTRLTFDEWNKVKKAIGGMGALLDKQAQNGTIPGELVGASKQAYSAALKDLERWGRSGRNTRVKQAYDKASAHYRDEMTPFEANENDLLRKIVFGKFDDTEYANLGTLFTEPSAQKLEQLVKYSDAKGRRALENLMKRKVVEKTTGHSKPTGVEPIRAALDFEQLSPQSKQMLPGAADQAELYARIGKMMERAGDEPPGTRSLLEQASHGALQAAPWLLPAGGVLAGYSSGQDGMSALQGGALGMLAALAAGRTGTALTTTRPGIRMLASSPTVLPGGPLSYMGAPLGLDPLETLLGNR